MIKMTELETLKNKRNLEAKALNKTIDKIYKLESDLGLPELEKKYLNKFFKIKSTYGGKDKGWFNYIRVDSISYPNSFKGVMFCTTSDGKRMFDMEYNYYLSYLKGKVTKEEFNYKLDMVLTYLQVKLTAK